MSGQGSVDTAEQSAPVRTVEIDFFYLDLDTCSRCVGSDKSLREALDALQPVLKASGVEVALRKTLVETEDQARALRFVSSPTIRINGRDIAGELKETSCADCGELCACEGAIDCRVWLYRGEEHNEAPVGLIIDAVLGEVYGGQPVAAEASPYDDVPDNLKGFFAGRSAREAAGEPTAKTHETSLCCSEKERVTCCEPSTKPSCCGSGAQACGCR
jgi:hypothetical protein